MALQNFLANSKRETKNYFFIVFFKFHTEYLTMSATNTNCTHFLDKQISSLKDPVSSSNTFRLQNKKIHLTYKSHIDPQEWIDYVTKSLEKEIKCYSIVHETGKRTVNYDHTHILVEFVDKINTMNPRFFDWPSQPPIHPHIKKVSTKKHWNNTVNYHKKEGTPYTNISSNNIETVLKDCNTKADLLVHPLVSLSNIGGALMAFSLKPEKYGEEPVVDWLPWQKQLLDEVEQEPDDRKIIWYYDQKGGSGKTFMAKHMARYKGAFVSTKANAYHTATQFQGYLDKYGNDAIVICIFNFSRAHKSHKVYEAIEALKDGMITAEKYRGETLLFPSPHLIVLANYLPMATEISLDRWDIRVLHNRTIIANVIGQYVVQDDSENYEDFNDYEFAWLLAEIHAIRLPRTEVSNHSRLITSEKTSPDYHNKSFSLVDQVDQNPQTSSIINTRPTQLSANSIKTIPSFIPPLGGVPVLPCFDKNSGTTHFLKNSRDIRKDFYNKPILYPHYSIA